MNNRIGLLLGLIGLLTVQSEALAGPVLAAPAAPASVTAKDAVEPAHAAWATTPETPLRLHRSPPLYAPGVRDDGVWPVAAVRLLRLADGVLAVRLQWADATQDRGATAARYPDRGDAKIYKRHTEQASRFADGACAMVPRRRGAHDRNPSLVMGDAQNPADLFYWRAGLGFQRLRAAGRSTVARTGQPFEGRARWSEGRWNVTFILREVPARTPISFAIWDGSKEHRDGIKYFSLWYEIK